MNFNRRNFIKTAAINLTVLTSVPVILSAAMPAPGKRKKGSFPIFKKNDVVLFQGDSITDAGRNKERQLPNTSASFGTGYALIAASALLNMIPEKNLTIYNRGISGNKVFNLVDRWQADCIDLKPSLLSILIGVNDFWSILKSGYNGTLEKYQNDYRSLMDLTRKALPDTKLVIGEPFAVAGGTAITDKWYPDFDGYRLFAKKIASEYNAIFIPYHNIFNEALKHAPASYWAPDGVHPSMAGSSLMAEAWLTAIS